MPIARGWAILVGVLGIAGCGGGLGQAGGIPSELLSQARPIGLGARFHPPARGAAIDDCRRKSGRRFAVHVEVFAENRVVLLPAGIGAKPPRAFSDGRLVHASCYGPLVTLDPTGVVLVRVGVHPTLGDLFRQWGQPLGGQVVASFHTPAARTVRAFVDGRRWRGPVRKVPLGLHQEIVVELGPYVPPHHAYVFPPGS